MSRESADVKGRRLLVEGRLIVDQVLGRKVIATCRGDSGEVYRLGYDTQKNEWRCTCPAKTRCSHLVALQLVVAVRPDNEGRR
jgi:uncharacterized Zn finger protein